MSVANGVDPDQTDSTLYACIDIDDFSNFIGRHFQMHVFHSRGRAIPCKQEGSIYEGLINYKLYGPRREKTCLQGVVKNTGADQPAHLCSLISAFVIRFLESTICKLATDEISIF